MFILQKYKRTVFLINKSDIKISNFWFIMLIIDKQLIIFNKKEGKKTVVAGKCLEQQKKKSTTEQLLPYSLVFCQQTSQSWDFHSL